MSSPSQTLQEPADSLDSDPEIGQTPAASWWVCRMPPELLSCIFKELQRETTSSFLEFPPHRHGPESVASSRWVPALTSICRTWRQTAFSDRSLWQSLIIRSTAIGNGLVVQQFLERSDPMPIRLYVHDDFRAIPRAMRRGEIDSATFFISLQNHTHRIESLYLAGWLEFSRTHHGVNFLGNSLPNLQNLHLDFQSLSGVSFIFGGGLSGYPIYESPALKRLSLAYTCSSAVLPSTLTHLCLDETPSIRTLKDFLRTLGTLPRLRVLCLAFAVPFIAMNDGEHVKRVQLPELRYIRFRKMFWRNTYPLILLYKLITPAIENIIWHGSSTFDHVGELLRFPYAVPPTSQLESVTHLITRDQESLEIQSLTSTIFSPLRIPPEFAEKLVNVRHLTIADRGVATFSFGMVMGYFLRLETFECELSFMGSEEFKYLEADNLFLLDLAELILWVKEDDLKNTAYDPFRDIQSLDPALPHVLRREGHARRDRRNATSYVIRLNVGDIECWKDQDVGYAFGGRDE